jgi:hypothetical protein
MKTSLIVLALFLGLSTFSHAEIQDLPTPGDELPQPLPPDPGDPVPPPSQQPAPSPAPGRIKIGDFVLSGPFKSGQYFMGMVVDVSKDGRTISVRDDDDQQVYKRESRYISRKMEKGPRNIWPGDRVLTGPFRNQQYSQGTVRAVYERGLFIVIEDSDGRSYVRNEPLVAKRIDCFKGFCSEYEVMSAGNPGIIRSVFDSGKFIVMEYRDRKLYLRNYSDLRKR